LTTEATSTDRDKGALSRRANVAPAAAVKSTLVDSISRKQRVAALNARLRSLADFLGLDEDLTAVATDASEQQKDPSPSTKKAEAVGRDAACKGEGRAPLTPCARRRRAPASGVAAAFSRRIH